jgi:hypothetical protein
VSEQASGRFYIVNDCDRPEPRLIAEKIDGKLWYLNNEIRERFPAMPMERATPLEDFGFDLWIENGRLFGKPARESTAKYSDGKPRRWQGEVIFIINLNEKKRNP